MSEVCRCLAGILTSSGVCRCIAGTLTSSGVCRCLAGILTSVRGMQVPCRYPDQCQGFAEIGLLSLWTQRFPGCIIRRLCTCTHAPHREGNSMSEPPLFNIGIRYQGLQVQGPVHYPLSYHFTPTPMTPI